MSLTATNRTEVNTVELTFEIGPEDFEAAVERAYQRNKKNISLPGFRKGKVTRKMAEARMGEGVFYEDALNDLINTELTAALQEADFELVDRPSVDAEKISKEEGVVFKAICITKPVIEIDGYKGIKASKTVAEVTDADVEAQVDMLRKRNARLVSVDDRAAEMGDEANIDFEGSTKEVIMAEVKKTCDKCGPSHFIPGASQGFARFLWEGRTLKEDGRVGVSFHRISPDGESGFPGNCDCTVTYWLTEDNVVKVEYAATTDKPTVVNLSNHSFFNLKGRKGGYVMDHLLKVEADEYIQNNEQMCPDLILPVKDSPFDFRTPHRVDYRLDTPNEHLRIMKGMSACWVVRGWDGSLRLAADLYEPESGRGVQTWTTEPAILTYTGRAFNGTMQGKYGPVDKYGGMLLETIHFADSPNQPRFPSTVLRPGEKYYSTTEWRFYAK